MSDVVTSGINTFLNFQSFQPYSLFLDVYLLYGDSEFFNRLLSFADPRPLPFEVRLREILICLIQKR